MNLMDAVALLVHAEPDLNAKLDLLTEIELTTKQDATYDACQTIRNVLCEENPADLL